MPELNDHELLCEFVCSGSDEVFGKIVARHVNLVYSTALRFTGNPHHSQEITQAVFVILARKASKLSPRTLLSGWLYQTARLTAANFVKSEHRRQWREQEAYMQSTLNEPDAEAWGQIAPLLEEAMGRLGETDRNAVVLRYFENKTAVEIAAALKLTEAAVHKRVGRALEKLRSVFTRRGVMLTTTIIAGAVSANSVQAAPVGLAVTIAGTAVKGSAISTSTITLVKGVLKIMAWTKAKTAIVVGAAVLTAGMATTVVVEKVVHPNLSSTDLSWADDPKYWQLDNRVLDKLPPVFILRPTRFPNTGGAVISGSRAIGINHSLDGLIAHAYGHNWRRMVIDIEIPRGKYDFLVTLPGGPRELLRTEIEKRLGLVARKEFRDAEVLQLHSKTADRPGLKPGTGENSGSSSGPGEIKAENQPISLLTADLESHFGIPVTDHTGLTGRYDITLKWPWNPNVDQVEKCKRIKQALLDQLGFELVPGREKIEMLVIERVQKPLETNLR